MSPAKAGHLDKTARLRVALIYLSAALLALLAVRSAAVEYWARSRPDRALAFWSSHPLPRMEAAMGAIGAAAGSGRAPPESVLAEVRSASQRVPLGAQAFLVEGTRAASVGNNAVAEKLLIEARARDPRSLAARFLLADLYLRSGRVERGLTEAAALARLVPGGLAPLAPALAAYARQPEAAAQLQRIMGSDSALRNAVLANLANDPDDADLVLRLAAATGGDARGRPSEWQSGLVQRLVDRGEFARAHVMWQRFNAVTAPDPQGLYNPAFAPSTAPPPFNWRLASASSGFAEPARGGGLQVIYYGRDDAVLASQLTVLTPGRYRLTGAVSGSAEPAATLAWRVTCLPGNTAAATRPLEGASFDLSVTIPASGCKAQAVELIGSPSEMATTVEITIRDLQLRPEPR